MSLLTLWLMYSAFGITFFSLVFLWAVRTRQFAGQDRAARLPLECPAGGLEPPAPAGGRRELLVPLALIALAVLMLGAALWRGLK